MAKKRTFREFNQGTFKPLNKSKCLNKNQIVYRSSLEQQLMIILDKNPNVIAWSSESVIIPYKHPVKSAQSNSPQYARYFVDFYFKLKIGDKTKEFLVEVKPHSQTKPPTQHGNKKQSTIVYETLQWAVNKAKWEAAKKYCESKNMEFIIIDEKNIKQLLQN